jgi:hypothetical protein
MQDEGAQASGQDELANHQTEHVTAQHVRSDGDLHGVILQIFAGKFVTA